MKYFVVIVFLLGIVGTSQGQNMKCGIKTCFIELFNLNDINFSTLIKKAHLISFCVRECSPPALSEFLQSLSFAFTKNIPGSCSGKECIQKNRFVALAHCFDNQSWPLIHCGVKLVELMQVKHMKKELGEDQKNKTCDIVIESIMCIENILQKCDNNVGSLVKGGFLDAVELGVNIYCSRSYKQGGIHITVPTEPTTLFRNVTYTPRPPVAKGYRSRRGGGAAPSSYVPSSWLVTSAVAIAATIGLLHT